MLSAWEAFFSFAFLSSNPHFIDSMRAASNRNIIEEDLPVSKIYHLTSRGKDV
jgi:hypothetical protein